MSGQEEMEKRTAKLFAESVDGLDAETRSRLNRGRQRALEAAKRRPWFAAPGVWLPAAAAAVAAIAIVTWNGADAPTVPAADGAPRVAADLEMLMDDADLEMLEDLEFYSWMEAEETAGDDGGHVG